LNGDFPPHVPTIASLVESLTLTDSILKEHEMNRRKSSQTLARSISLTAIVALMAFTAAAQTERIIHTFNGSTHIDGSGSEGNLIADSAGNLYGTSFGSGSGAAGVVFELSPPVPPSGAWTETILHSFSGADGADPAAGLVFDSAGNLYGTTAYGGNGPCTVLAVVLGCGVVFQLSPPTSGGSWTESVLYNFQGGNDSGGSQAALIFDSAGNLYGTTSGSGFDHTSNGVGAVFQLSPPSVAGGAWTETTICDFPSAVLGLNPFGPVVFDASGNLYGTTYIGGNLSCGGNLECGVVYQLAPPSQAGGSWTETVIHTFAGGRREGANPVGGLVIDPSGTIFGTTSKGGSSSGAGFGTVFEMRPPSTTGGAWAYATIHVFGGTGDGVAPRAGVSLGSGLYGTTSLGGALNVGTVFQLTPGPAGSPWTETVLHSFQYSGTSHTDGSNPYGGIVLYRGALVGTTLGGGAKNSGIVYAVIP
jgi:hypothetical protein